MMKSIKSFLQKNKFTNKVMTDYGFRTVIFSLGSFAIGLAFAIFNIVVAVSTRSIWYGALAIYYMFLDVIRGVVLYNGYRQQKDENAKKKNIGLILYGVCGILFLIMTFILSAIVMFLARSEKVYEYSITVIYMVAGYTFWRIGASFYNFIKAKNHKDYTVRSLRNINVVTALVSCLSLQSAALYAFSTGARHNVVNAITGGIVCILIVLIGLFMTVSAGIKIYKLRKLNEVDNGRAVEERNK